MMSPGGTELKETPTHEPVVHRAARGKPHRVVAKLFRVSGAPSLFVTGKGCATRSWLPSVAAVLYTTGMNPDGMHEQAGPQPQAGNAPPLQDAGTPTAVAVAQTKQLISMYTNDPFRLSSELQNLKSAYISQQFHITIGPADS